MRCRRSKQFPEMRGLAFFGSYGKTVTEETVTVPIDSGIDFSLDNTNAEVPNLPANEYQASKLLLGVMGSTVTVTAPEDVNSHTICFILIYYKTEDRRGTIGIIGHPFTNRRSASIEIRSVDESGVYFVVYISPYVDADKETLKKATITYTRPVFNAIKTEDGKSFAEEQEGVACSLTQRLSVIKGELFYQINTGLPLFDKGTTSTTFDAWIVQTVMSHPDVKSITSFSSYTENHSYHCGFVALTKYGEIEVTI